jgi:hypothetical protein
MTSTKDPLMEAGLAALGDLLPSGYSVAPSSLGERDIAAGTWVVVRGQAKKGVTALVLARRRVELRDLGAIAAIAARTNKPALLLSDYLPPAVRERLRGFGIGYWDLNGNARIGLPGIDLCLERDGAAPTGDKGDRHARSLCGEMAGRVARVLIDVRPPHTLSGLAEQARVDKSCASRLVAFLVETGLALRQPRGKIAKVRWQELLRRFALDSPLQARGEAFRFLCARGLPDFLARLARSGFLHALTGETAFAGLALAPLPPVTVLYVDDVQAAVAQFGLHPASDAADVMMVKPADRSVFQRSREDRGLRYVSPSLMAADLASGDAFEAALGWMAAHESAWRKP